ncbi:MAG: NAD(P)-dependent oxidoreductase [Chloroflexi bacterium]|nr:NAD(P)-dependent oxidoreductase [Chloroflexota bacterium]
MSDRLRVGFVGLGNMGSRMARRVLDAGFPLVVYDVKSELMEPLVGAGAEGGTSPRDIAARCEVLLTSLPSLKASERVFLGSEGAIHSGSADQIWIEASTVTPGFVSRLAEAATPKRIRVMDASVSGGIGGAAAGTLTLMVGGDAADLERVRPVLEPIGTKIYHCGPLGMGATFKLINNGLAHANVVAAFEAFALATKVGADPRLLLEVIQKSSGGSWAVGEYLPKVLKRAFTPGMKTNLAYKDSELLLEVAREAGAPLYVLSAVHAAYEWGKAVGYGEDDYSRMIEIYEQVLGVRVAE